MKKAFFTMIAAAVLFAIGVGVIFLSLGKIVKSAVEAQGPRVLGAPVTLGSAEISPWTGRGELRELAIGNPEGFKSGYALKVAAIEIEVKLSSLLTDTIVVERVAVREPDLVWEIGQEGSNLIVLQRNAQSAVARSEDARSAGEAGKKGKSLRIGSFTVTGGKVGLSVAALGGQGLAASLPDVRLTDLGGEGRSPAQVEAQAFGAIAASAQGAVAEAGGNALRNSALSALAALFNRKGQ